MTQTLTREFLETVPPAEQGFIKYDKVRLHFLFQVIGEAEWHDAGYSIDGEIVGGPQACDRPEDPFEPYVLPNVALPEGDPFATAHPFRLERPPFMQELPDGQTVLLRYEAVLRDDLSVLAADQNTFAAA